MKTKSIFPFLCTAKFKSRCPETGRAIHPGDKVAYYPSERLQYHETSSHYEDVILVLSFEPETIPAREGANR